MMDHHCPWINNCVGYRNQKAFVLFLFYTAMASVEAVGIILLCLASTPWTAEFITLATVALVEAAFFCYFTGDYLKEQLESICDNQTIVESHQQRFGRRKTSVRRLKEVLGTNTSLWLVPVQTDIAIDFEEPVYTPDEWKQQTPLGEQPERARPRTRNRYVMHALVAGVATAAWVYLAS